MRAQLPRSPLGFDEQDGAAGAILVICAVVFFALAFAAKVYDQGWPPWWPL